MTFLLIALASVCYTISQLQIQGKLRWAKSSFGFWGYDSWQFKYKRYDHHFIMVTRPNWYYKFFEIPYVEKFPGSATVFVRLTDGYHLMQFLSTKFIYAAIAINTSHFWMIFLGTWLSFSVVFTTCYKFLNR